MRTSSEDGRGGREDLRRRAGAGGRGDRRARPLRRGGVGRVAPRGRCNRRDPRYCTARDLVGDELAAMLADAGVIVIDLGLPMDATPEKVRIRAAGQSLVRLDTRSPRSAPGALPAAAVDAIRAAGAVLVSDYGRGLAAADDVRAAIAATRAPVVWDPHPRRVAPVPGAQLATPNESEARTFAPSLATSGLASDAARAAELAARWQAGAVAITVGAVTLAATIRAQGGTVIATGGCFDLLHAGHVAMINAARRLGDCLLVCLNADDSVRRLKGPDRPLQPYADRAAVLAALDCVDAVEIFYEDTPDAALDRLRPHIFVKGGDYAAADLPEAATMARWGGQAVVVPYLAGHSSSRLVEETRRVSIWPS